MSFLRALWEEIMTPSARDESPYATAVIFIGHAMLGAALSGLGLVAVVGGAIGLAVVYFVVKERADLGRGGGLADSLVDTAGVALGAFYGPAWWPVVVMALAGGAGLGAGAKLMRSKSLRRTEWWFPGAQLQGGIMFLTLITGCVFFAVARWLQAPVADEHVYGPFITVAHAEAWALPLIIGPALALIGQAGDAVDDIPLRLAQLWRLLGNFITGGVIGLFGYGAIYAPSFEPLFIYSVVYAALHAWLFAMTIDDMFWESRHG